MVGASFVINDVEGYTSWSNLPKITFWGSKKKEEPQAQKEQSFVPKDDGNNDVFNTFERNQEDKPSIQPSDWTSHHRKAISQESAKRTLINGFKAGSMLFSMMGLGLGAAMCQSGKMSCYAGMSADAAFAVVGSHLSPIVATVTGHMIMGALGVAVGGAAIWPGLVLSAMAATTGAVALGVTYGAKTSMCQYYCSVQQAAEVGSKIFQINPPNLKDPAIKNAMWCLEYCPIMTTQRYTCKLLDALPWDQNGQPQQIENIQKFADILALNGTHPMTGLRVVTDQKNIHNSKLFGFVERNIESNLEKNPNDPNDPNDSKDKPHFCLNYSKYKTLENSRLIANVETFEAKYQIVYDTYKAWLEAASDPFLKCTQAIFKQKYTAVKPDDQVTLDSFKQDYEQYLKEIAHYYVVKDTLQEDKKYQDLLNDLNRFFITTHKDERCMTLIHYVKTLKTSEEKNAEVQSGPNKDGFYDVSLEDPVEKKSPMATVLRPLQHQYQRKE